MKRLVNVIIILIINSTLFAQSLESPDGRLRMNFSLSEEGKPQYDLSLGTKAVIAKSSLGIRIKNRPGLDRNLLVRSTATLSHDETWKPLWGEESEIKNLYNELEVQLQQASEPGLRMVIRFRLFNDGLGFRYEFPAQPRMGHFIVEDEQTEFCMTGNHTAFWIPGDYDTQEYLYSMTPISAIESTISSRFTEIGTRKIFSSTGVQTPLLVRSADGLYFNIHEANLHNYPVMQLDFNKNALSFKAHLVPDALGNKAYAQTPFETPWRAVIVATRAIDLLASRLILNLNDPCAIEDVSWIKPKKYVGIWWEMHVGAATWNYSDSTNLKLATTDWSRLKPNGRHGATTQRTVRYIDFAAQHGFDGVLVEGWNVGWEDWYGQWKEDVFDFVTPYPDFDLAYLNRYAQEKGVRLIMHHETSSSVTNYERQLDTAFRLMKHFGYDAVKTGYVGWIIPRGEHHDGQWMVKHQLRVAAKAAENKIMINTHESHRPTGQHRTWPNWLACEAARGNEFNAWSIGNPPDHETILPFTRLMGGPMDYTPGIFQINLDHYQPGKKEKVHSTIARQLALYVTMYSPLQMAADLPESYERFPDAFQFIKDVPVDWDKSVYVEAEPGDFLTVARKAKAADQWYIGAITDENKRETSVPLTFLQPGQWYLATIYSDGDKAHFQHNPMSYTIRQFLVNSENIINIPLAPGGGCAIRIVKAESKMLKTFKKYR